MPKDQINPKRRFAVEVVRQLRSAGHAAYWAGGCVRDQLLSRPPKDYDVATDATPEKIQQIFGRHRTLAIGASFGVITVKGPKAAGMIEVATFRKDAAYSDGRHPDSVTFSSAEEDARRRDFTINGLFFDPVEERVIDYVGGQDDLSARRLRAIGDPRERFAEDKLRMLRAVRFAASLDFALEENTLHAIQAMAAEISVVSAERIAMEMRRMLVEPGRVRAVELLLQSNLAPHVLPEIVPQSQEDHQKLAESLAVLDRLGSVSFQYAGAMPISGAMPTLAVGMLEPRENAQHAHAEREHGTPHDIPQATPNFPLALMTLVHRLIAPDAALEICRRWKLSNDEADRVYWLLKHQSSLVDARSLRWSQLQPLLISPGIDDLLTFLEAASPSTAQAAAYCREQLKRPREQLDPQPLVTGDDLLELGIPQGPQYRILLEEIRRMQLDEILQSRQDALDRLKEHGGIA